MVICFNKLKGDIHMKNNIRITAGIMALMLVFGAGTVIVHTKFGVSDSLVATSTEVLKYGSLSYKVSENGNITITSFDDSVTEVEIPSEIDGCPVTSIGITAFLGKKLTSITIPESITTIERSAFSSCSALESVVLPNSLVTLGEDAFSNCVGLQSVELSGNISSISGSAFRSCTGLKEITIPDGITSIGNQAFDGCTGLKTINFPDSLINISPYAFRECSALESVTIPENVTSISIEAFSYCSSLKEITIMNPECSIGNGAISNSYGVYSGVIYGLEGSTAQEYAVQNGNDFKIIGSSDTTKGDINGDGLVDAVDASIILGYYSYLSTKPEDETAMTIDEYQAAQQ